MDKDVRYTENKYLSPEASIDAPWVDGAVDCDAGKVIRIKTQWSRKDSLGQIRARISSFRMKYKVAPGLYAAGRPDDKSPVLVSANYKLSFDILRRELTRLDTWILVLDTKGINVWCAAGKGTFGTNELVEKIRSAGLDKIVKHRRIIVPQLGAPGIHAHVVKKVTGFSVLFGPVYARDIKAYLQAGNKATQAMRTVSFPIRDRLILTPMEIIPALKKSWIYLLALFVIFGLQTEGFIFSKAWNQGFPFLLMGGVALFVGAFLTPLMLPFIPFRSFAVKGWLAGSVLFGALFPFINRSLHQDLFLLIAVYLFFPLISSYLALNFTGTTTFTHISGVKKELKIALPIYIAAGIISIGLIIIQKIKIWGLA